MNHTEILLDDNTSNEEKFLIANEIINTHNLPLSTEQILFAHKKMCDHIYENEIHKYDLKYNRVLLLNKIFNININMYVAIILALCGKYNSGDLYNLMIFGTGLQCLDIGVTSFENIYFCYDLLDYYDFDVSNISNIEDGIKNEIQKYRNSKYSGKLTKRVIKNDQ